MIRFFSMVVTGSMILSAQPPMAGFRGMPYEVTGRRIMSQQVKGSPYSAQEVTETTQTLADGSHIKNSLTSQVYRDIEGRVRMERTVGRSESQKTMITIVDPVAGTQYEMDPQAKTARKMSFHPPTGNASSATSGQATPQSHDGPMGNARFNRGPGAPGVSATPVRPVAESLGHQNMEGVDAVGTRTTTTIPAGTMGNDAPIQIVNERWYSSDLQTTVMSRHADPRSGEVVFRLTNISRANPDSSLFTVPADVQVTEAKPFGRGTRGPVE